MKEENSISWASQRPTSDLQKFNNFNQPETYKSLDNTPSGIVSYVTYFASTPAKAKEFLA